MLTIFPFGATPAGRQARLFVLSNSVGASVGITDFGASMVSCKVPDGHGNFPDVALGYSGPAGYASDTMNLGAIVGRCANRIAGASFELGGSSYRLAANDGANNLHSGPHRWSERLWDVTHTSASSVTFSLSSRRGDQGFPGSVKASVTYELSEGNALTLRFDATPSDPTIVNLISHAYWNLNGHASGDVLGHSLQIDAQSYTPMVDHIPTGEVSPVEGTPYDFRQPQTLGARLEQLPHGYDDNYCLDNRGRLAQAARLVGDKTGITLTVSTDAPGMQVFDYDAFDIEGAKDGVHYGAFAGVALETQHYPDAIHHKNFPQPVYTLDRPFRSTTVFAFGIG